MSPERAFVGEGRGGHSIQKGPKTEKAREPRVEIESVVNLNLEAA